VENLDTFLHWRVLRTTLLARSVRPARHPSFVLYFVVAVLLVGAAGVWFELHKLIFDMSATRSLSAIRTSLVTFFPALAGSACMQIVLAEDEHKSMRAVAVCLLTGLSILALVISPATVGDVLALVLAAVGSVVALWTWWIANALQRDLQDGPDAAIGKADASSGLVGTLDGFRA